MTGVHRTTCPLDCPDACALSVSVEDGKLVAIEAASRNGVTSGFICSKVASFHRRLYHKDRLTTPLKRRGAKGDGEFQTLSWDDAIAEITDRFTAIRNEFGGEAILPFHYGGSNGVLSDGFIDRLYFARLGASRLDKTICALPTTKAALGLYGKMPGVAFQDYVHAKCIVIWGANPKGSNIHLVPFLKEAKRRGAFIVSIDPRRNFSRNEIDLHLPVRPGTDLALALTLIQLWDSEQRLDRGFLDQFAVDVEVILAEARKWPLARAAEVCDVPRDDIIEFAERYASSSPAVLRCGWGLERNRNGLHAAAAVLALPALLGKFGAKGGGYTMSNSGAARANVDAVLGGVEWNTRSVNMTQLAKALDEFDDPPIKSVFVYNANPVATVPNQTSVVRGLGRDGIFTVVFDQVMTDTAVYADIVLPATTFLEHEDLRVGYGNYTVGAIRPAIGALGEARSNADVFAELGRAMNFDDAAFGWPIAEHLPKVSAELQLNGKGVNVDELMRGENLSYDFPGPTPVQFGTVYPLTNDGKVHFAPPELGPAPYHFEELQSKYPLALISPASSRLVTSTFGEFNLTTLAVVMNPHDAAERKIASGDTVRVFNELGKVHCEVKVSDRIRRGVVVMPKGAWRKSSENGWTSTVLCPDHVDAVHGAACFNDARVEVEPRSQDGSA